MIRPKANFLPPGLNADEAAAMWHIRLEGDGVDDVVRAEFEAWRLESVTNADAFDRAERAWNAFADATGDAHLDALRESALATEAEPRRGRWVLWGLGLAASMLAVVVAGGDSFTYLQGGAPQQTASAPSVQPKQLVRPERGDFVTSKGEQKRVVLADGTAVTLNTDSAVRVAYSSSKRVVSLLRGQVLFEVAKNAARPFVVQAGDRQVTALGTVFEVRLDPGQMKVTLVEGKVVVDGIADKPGPGRGVIVPTVLKPGQELVVALGERQQLAAVDVERQLRWREGFVEFDDATLDDAVREINRYSDRQIVLANERTGQLRVSGIFRMGNTERFAAIVGELLPVKMKYLPDSRIELEEAK